MNDEIMWDASRNQNTPRCRHPHCTSASGWDIDIFIPYEKLSKKEQRERNKAKRGT